MAFLNISFMLQFLDYYRVFFFIMCIKAFSFLFSFFFQPRQKIILETRSRCQIRACKPIKSGPVRVIMLNYFVLCVLFYQDALNILWPGISHLLSRPKSVSWLLDPQTCFSIRGKNLCEKHKSGAGGKKDEDATKTQSFGPVSLGSLQTFFVPRDWAVILSVKHEKWGQMSSVP